VGRPPSLGGIVAYGRPDVRASQEALALYDSCLAPTMSDAIDVIVDGRRLEIDSDTLAHFIGWLRTNLPRDRPRIRQQIGIVRDDLPGMMLTGILPMVGAGTLYPYQVFTDPRAAYRLVGAEALADEIDAIVERAAGLPRLIANLRALLRERRGDISLRDAARALAISPSTLQRMLGAHGASFGDEQREARWQAARDLLLSTTDKVGVIARRLAVSEGTLAQLVRERAGCTPDELRRRNQGS
jgi:AraC-like DNA-binding protein